MNILLSRIGNRCLERLAAGDAALQVGEGHNKAALIGVLYQLHAIRQEGISMNQYCVYLLSRNDAAAR